MTCDCRTSNPLVRDGTSQAARTLAALDPAFAPLDGRDVAQWLEYLRRLARHLRYHDTEDRPAGDWAPFIDQDASSVAAEVAAWDAEGERRDAMALAALVVRGEDAGGNFRKLVDGLFALASRMDRWSTCAAEGLAFPEALRQQVRGGLHMDLKLLVGIVQTAEQLKLLALPAANAGVTAEQVLTRGLGKDWWWDEKAFAWAALLSPADPPEPPEPTFGPATEAPARRLARAVEYLFPVIDDFTRALARVKSAAADDLRRTLTDWPRHEPPMALLLAFLQLFRHARRELDGLTGRHLKYHFQDVLGLQPRGAAPDRTFVTFELAPRAEQQVLPAGTVLLAGKDPQGLLLRYALGDALRVNGAVVAAIRTVHRTKEGGVTAAEVTPAPGQGWPVFGSAAHGKARIGFAIASPLLALAGGTRTITVTVNAPKPTKLAAYRASTVRGIDRKIDLLAVELTTPKGWTVVEAEEASAVLRADGAFELKLSLKPKDPPITPYMRAKHEDSLDTPWPVCRVRIDPGGRNYDPLAALVVRTVKVKVHVDDVPGLSVETEAGRVDPAKPFLPFGAQPRVGSRFSVHCAELAARPLTALTLQLEWLDPGPTPALKKHYEEYAPKYVPEGFMVKLDAGSGDQWKSKEHELQAPKGQPASYTAALAAGMVVDTVRVELSAPAEGFGHGVYPEVLTNAVQQTMRTAADASQAKTLEQLTLLLGQVLEQMQKGKFPNVSKVENACTSLRKALTDRPAVREGKPPALPKPPITPRVAGLTLSYEAEVEVTTDTAPDTAQIHFFHYHPFGETQEQPGRTTRLLPLHPDEGELYLGLVRAQPQQRLQLLVELEEGSGDASAAAPAVKWAYLGQDQAFHPLDGEALADGTRGLVRSGLVGVVLPANATCDGTRMPAGYHWLRLSVAKHTAVLGNLMKVHAQAAEAVLLEPERHAAHLARPLAAGCVQKLERSPPTIKKVTQPLPSFGGRAPETAQAPTFLRRVSERLRHKQRAITPHDYETLVLEAFPELHKVRCLNHTRVTATNEDREASPGCVTIVVVPRLVGHARRAPFTPLASLATLTAVQEFLAQVTGPFVRLYVVNPTYEEVRLTFGVRFARGQDPALLLSQLQTELDAFLSPWAFEDREILFGGMLHRSTLLGFVGGRPYVDVVTDFRVQRTDTPGAVTDDEVLVPRSARGVLVSAGGHAITAQEASL